MDDKEEISASSFESLLEEDSTFVEFFNSFLALPMFPIRLHYNPDTGCFEEFKQKLADDVMDDIARRATSSKRFTNAKSAVETKGFKIGYYVKFLEKEEGIDWIKKNRLPLFLRSEICAEYKLARSLSNAQTRYLMNILIDSSNLNRTAFDETAAPKYRTNRNRGGLPGLAEFQQQMFTEKEGSSESNSVFGDSSSVNVSDASDSEIPEFSEIDYEIQSSEYGEGIEAYTSRYSKRNRRALVRDVQLDMDSPNDDEATHSVDCEYDKAAEEGASSKENCTDLKREISPEVTAQDEFNGEDQKSNGKIGDLVDSRKEDFDDFGTKKYVDDYNVLTVVESLKDKYKAARELPSTEYENEIKLIEEEDRKSILETGCGKLQTLREVSMEEEVLDSHFEKTPLPYIQMPVSEELDINNNEVKDHKPTADVDADSIKEVMEVMEEKEEQDNKENLTVEENLRSGVPRRVSFESRADNEVEDHSKSVEIVNSKFLQKRHSVPHNNTLALYDFQAPQTDDESTQSSYYRRRSMPTPEARPVRKRQSRGSIGPAALQELTKLLSLKMKTANPREELLSFCEETEADDDSDSNQSFTEHRRPIDIASKIGMDAFKLFLIDTPGEKLFLLWIEIEKLKSCESSEERQNMVQGIRKRFFRSGAVHELKIETVRQWSISNTADLCYDTLVEIQDKVQAPLEQYWCARFTFHQKRSHKCTGGNYVNNDHSCIENRCATHQRELKRVPQRPNTCFPNLRTKQRLGGRPVDSSGKESQVQRVLYSQEVKEEESPTKAKIRSQSAHPRLVNNPNIRDVNLSYKQLQIITTVDESCGFKALPYCRYKHDASNSDEKANVRLYIQPLPPSDCRATTVVRSNTSLHAADRDMEQEEIFGSEHELIGPVVECLLHEKDSGSFFYQHLQEKKNQLAMDCYKFWKALQDYSEHFFSESFSPSVIKQKAGFIFTTYIVSGSKSNINCCSSIQAEIHRTLDPPYEDLFDKAELHAIKILSSEYDKLFSEENEKYEEIKKNEKIKYLDVRSTLKKPKNRLNDNMGSEDAEEEEEDHREKISVEEVNLPLPPAADGVTFESFIRSKSDLESFKQFLERTNNKGLKDLLAWTEMENFRRSTRRNDQRNIHAKSVRINWLNNDYFFGSSSPATKEAQAEVRRLIDGSEIPERPPSPVILEAQKYVRARIERRWFLMFKETHSYQSKLKESNINEMVEDMIMKRRLQRSEAAWKILNSRWVSGSRDVIAFRQLLMDPLKCDHFRKFLSLKGELMEHNYNFWIEVQKYKELCHCQADMSLLKVKVQAIINVFIKSSVPPELQIDVPIEIAERLSERASSRVLHDGAYLFREAQTTVFRIMFNHWKEFLTFHASIEESKVGQHLEELQKKHKAEVRAKRMIADRRRLAKVAFEKRKKEKEERERFRERPRHDIASNMGHEKTISLISDDEETAYQTKTFSYSKFTIEQQLHKLEQRMRDEGYTLEEFTEGDFTHSHFNTNSEKKLYRRMQGIDDLKSLSGVSFRTHRRRNGSIWKVNRKGLHI